MATASGSSPAAEPEALKHSFSYLVNSIDTAALLPAALSRNLITDRQRTECYNEADPYKKAEAFVGYLQRAVYGDCDNYYTIVQILKETGQAKIASRLRDELAHSIRSMQQPSASSSTDEGQCVVVPEALVEELADLRCAFANLIYSYEEELQKSPEAQDKFVKFLPRLFRRAVEDHSFQSHFDTLVDEEVSLFNIHYLKRICTIFPEDVRATTRQLVDEYEQQRQRFMASTTVSQFKQLFPATATPSKLLVGKVPIKLKLKNDWGRETLDDLTKLVNNFGVSRSAFHLSKVEEGCIAVFWLCSTTEVKQLKMAILEAAGSLQTMGVLQVFIGEEELVLECSHSAPTAAAAVKQLEGPSDLPQSSGAQQSELMTPSPPIPATEFLAHKPVNVKLVHKTDIDYQCPICTELLTEPYLSIECGHHLCRQCRDRLLGIGKTECPMCREPDVLINAVLDKNVQRKVKSLKVRCSVYKKGCEWVGKLTDLHDHLQKRCVIAWPFACRFCSSRYTRRSEMREHSRRHCHKRIISCKNCGYYNTFTIVKEKHYPICPRSPIDCPNQHCPVEGLRRHELEQHLNECSHQLVDCPNTGCSVQLPRGEMKLHTLQQHNLVLEETKQAVAITPAIVSPQYLYNQTPMEFIISDYHLKKEANEEWHSSPFYTHNRGYKFRLNVFPNGNGIGSGSHLSVYAQLMRGEYDNELKWPFEGDIRVELLNLSEDDNHHSVTIYFNRYHDPDSKCTSCFSNQETEAYGKPQFISHTDLAPTTNTEYLRDDYLKLRVSAIVYSAPLFHLTPAWKDSLSTTQSGAQFTITEYSKRMQFDNHYFSPPFTTNSQGYKLCLRVDSNGNGKDSHLSIYAYIMKGQHDDHLQWPFTGTIIVELLNWLEDKGHYKMTFPIITNSDFVRVTKGVYGKNSGSSRFISQSSLISSTNPQYLYQDCIHVRVQAIATTKPLFLLTQSGSV